jgi:hypothetical protein
VEGDVLLPPELEPLPLVPGPPMELVPPLLPPELPPLLAVSLLLLPPLEPLVLGLVLAVPPALPGEVLLLDEPVAPGPPAPAVPPSRLLHALSERPATTTKVAAAH